MKANKQIGIQQTICSQQKILIQKRYWNSKEIIFPTTNLALKKKMLPCRFQKQFSIVLLLSDWYWYTI